MRSKNLRGLRPFAVRLFYGLDLESPPQRPTSANSGASPRVMNQTRARLHGHAPEAAADAQDAAPGMHATAHRVGDIEDAPDPTAQHHGGGGQASSPDAEPVQSNRLVELSAKLADLVRVLVISSAYGRTAEAIRPLQCSTPSPPRENSASSAHQLEHLSSTAVSCSRVIAIGFSCE